MASNPEKGIEMSAVPYGSHEEEWDRYEDEQELQLPGRPRRRWLTPASAALLALVLGAIGFYVGVRVEKGQLSSSSTSASLGTSAGARAAAAGAGAGGAARLAGASGAGAGAGFAGGRSGFLSGAFGGGSASFGTVSSVDGKTIYVTETANGNVVKVQLSSATKITKSVGVSKSAIRPGDTIVVQGQKKSGGAISATSVSDAGARTAGAGAGSGSGSGSGAGSSSTSSSASSAVNSLFGGGG